MTLLATQRPALVRAVTDFPQVVAVDGHPEQLPVGALPVRGVVPKLQVLLMWTRSVFVQSQLAIGIFKDSAEIRFGAFKKGSKRLSSQLEAVLSALDILPLEEPVDERYAGL